MKKMDKEGDHMYLLKRFPLVLAALISCFTFSWTAAAGDTAPPAQPKPKHLVAFVIDDFGNNMAGTEEMLNLPVPLTVAVMPFMPSTKQDAELAHKKGHDVFVHMPMEPVKGKRSWLGPGAITTDLSDEEIRQRVEKAIDDVPHAIGMNNHMGSKVTADERIMRIIMSVVKKRGLIYLDSKTTDKSVAGKIAEEMGVPHAENRIFLDDVYSVPHITKQMEKICKLIGNHPLCIAIGHVGPPGKKTASVLRQYIPRIQKEAEFVTISQLIHQVGH
ncbi:divergent polysaccharide deacetylase family protein [Brevibacillus agri]|uniref:Divergent polysaccharide deacetylase family protein n=2 Tax=Brevibacillus agri TaxID=51101 RepID=A0A3M8ALF4_9BACL|nr:MULTISPECIES: divergent polysaccharide deacetylase family protein [Brevibacillus]QAV15186.1 divergent polysaccharide deacetylase family protein [Brevibacillus agri]QHZ57849.1 divergent polysaccharide deacetylase family protein [Brevibacillus sp. NSP2.1]RNB52021.1 divergent polysaccharide deacetylase family protein [Brevibacillus agri]